MGKDLVSLQKDNIRILVYHAGLRDPSDIYRTTRVNIVVGSEDITMDLGEYRQLILMLESLDGLVA